MNKTVEITLDPASVERAAKEIENFRKDFLRKCNELIETLTQYGYEFAKVEVARLGAFDTGHLSSSITGFFDTGARVGFIRADCWYAVYVEYGTGVVGSKAGHPDAGADGWVYDINHHGETGWVYFDERKSKFIRTKGQPSRPFMYNTWRELSKKAHEMASSLFGQ